MSDFANELIRLGELREKGLITQEEFDAAKAKLLGESSPSGNAGGPPPIPPTAPLSTPPPSQSRPSALRPPASDDIPPGIKGWSWGAFLWNWIWAIFNNTWIGLLALIPGVNLVMIFVLGAKGREWAWKNKKWDSVEHFNRVQRKWSLWGIWLVVAGFVLGFLVFGASLLFMGMAGSKMSGLDEPTGMEASATDETTEALQPAQIGQTISTNYFEFTVNDVIETSVIRPDGFTNDQAGPGNKYIVLDITMKNTDSEGRMFSEGALVAVHDGKELTFDNTETILANGYIAFETLNPLTTVRGKIVYKVPEELNGDFYWVPGRDSKRILLRTPSSVIAPVEQTAIAPDAVQPLMVEEAAVDATSSTEAVISEQAAQQQEELERVKAEADAAKAEAAKAKKDAQKAERALAEQRRRQEEDRRAAEELAAQQEQMRCPYSRDEPLTCASHGSRPAYCEWNFSACGNPRLSKKESKTTCNGKVNWDPDNNQLIVLDGCRAQFVPVQ